MKNLTIDFSKFTWYGCIRKLMQINIEYAKNAANRQLDKYFGLIPIKENPLETVAAFPWKSLITEHYSQEELIKLNLKLDPRGCLGRTALCFAICERFFPNVKPVHLESCEIVNDWFHAVLMRQWQKLYEPGDTDPPGTWIDELLMYEEPHTVAMIFGRQFDPLSVLMDGCEVVHSGIYRFPAWPSVTAGILVSQALSMADPALRVCILDQAEEVCAGLLTVRQARIHALVELGRLDQAHDILLYLAERSPSARTFFVLESLFGEQHPRCPQIYGPELWNLLQKRIQSQINISMAQTTES